MAVRNAQRWLTLDELGRASMEEVPYGVPVVIAYTITMVDGSMEDQVHVLLPSGRIGNRHWGALTNNNIAVFSVP